MNANPKRWGFPPKGADQAILCFVFLVVLFGFVVLGVVANLWWGFPRGFQASVTSLFETVGFTVL